MKSGFNKYSSSLGKAQMHLGFKVKYCHKIFFSEHPGVRRRCEEIFREVEAEHGFILKELGFDDDHVHLLADLSHEYSVCRMVKLLKGRSGRRILKEYPKIKREYFWGSGFWNPSYYFDSVGDANSSKMGRYVRNQKLTRKPDPGQKRLSDFLAA